MESFKTDPFIEALGLKRCEWNDGCDFCENPENGSYAKIYYPPEDNPECEYEICGKCVVENQKQHNGRFVEIKLPPIKLPF